MPSDVRCSTNAGCETPAYVPRSSGSMSGWRIVAPLDVRLVDERVAPRGVQRLVALPVEERVHDHAAGNERSAVVVVLGLRIVEPVAEHGLVPVHAAVDGLGRTGRAAACSGCTVTRGGVVRTMDSEPVALPGRHVGEVAVPHDAGRFGQLDACLGAVIVEEAQLDRVRDLGEQREVGADAVEGAAERRGVAGPDPRHRSWLPGGALVRRTGGPHPNRRGGGRRRGGPLRFAFPFFPAPGRNPPTGGCAAGVSGGRA